MKEFPPFRLDTVDQCLWREKERISLTPKAFAMLYYLVERAGRLVTQSEMLEALWPDAFVQPEILKTHILDIRHALGDDARTPSYIETLPRRGYRFIAAVRDGAAPESAPPPGRLASIAVLPFSDLSPDKDNEYFSDGLAEEIINVLARDPHLRVIARTSAFAFKGQSQDIRRIAETLGVANVLEGSVRKAGNRVRVTAQLVQASDGCHLWSSRYDSELTDIFAVQDEISQAITGALQAKLGPPACRTSAGMPGTPGVHPEVVLTPEEKRLAARPVINPVAHEFYLKGRYFCNQRGHNLTKAIEYFQRTITEEPGYAPAYAGLACSCALLGFYGLAAPMDAMPRAKEAALQALALHLDSAEAHALLGYVHTIFDRDWERAEKEFEMAFHLNRAYSPACCWRAILLFAVANWRQAVAELKRGLELDPLSAYLEMHLGIILCFAGEWPRAAEHCSKALELDPNFSAARCTLALAYFFESHVERAIQELLRAVETSGRDPWPLAHLAAVYAASGAHEPAQSLLLELEQRRNREYISSIHMAAIHFQFGNLDRGFDRLEDAVEERAALAPWIHRIPLIATEEVRSDVRFSRLMDRMGLNYVG